MKAPLIGKEDHFNGSYADWMTASLCIIVILQFIPGMPFKEAFLALGGVMAIAIILPIIATKFRYRRHHVLKALKR